MTDQILRRAARAIADLRKLAATLNEAGYPGDAIRLQGFAGILRELEGELVDAQLQMDSRVLCKSENVNNYIAATCIAASSDCLISSPATREKPPSLVAATVRASSRRRGS